MKTVTLPIAAVSDPPTTTTAAGASQLSGRRVQFG